GFAESHALSFGLLVYASAWLRLHYPAAFLAALLRAQPMGFYSPQSLIADARRHGVRVLRPDIQRSLPWSTLELRDLDSARSPGPSLVERSRDHVATGNPRCLEFEQPPVGEFDPAVPFDQAAHTRDGAFAVRLGLAEVNGIGEKLAQTI